MVDKVQNQSIDFVGEIKKQEQAETSIMDLQSQIAIGELNKNYNKMVNNMFKCCAEICIKNFNYPKLSNSEKTCVENCQKKFFSSYRLGSNLVNSIIEEARRTDIFSEKSEVDIVEGARVRKG